MLALMKKDLRIYFASPLAYLTLALFLFLTGFAFSSQLVQMTPGQLPEASMRGMIYFIAVILLFMVPLFTMRTFSEESRLQTMELLRTAPISDVQIVLAKFMGAFVFMSVLLLSTVIFPLIMYWKAQPDTGPMLTSYLGIWLAGGAFVSLGVFISSLMRSPMLAALLSFVALLMLWFVGGLEQSWAAHISIIRHLESFSIGVLSMKDLSYYVLFIGTFLFLTVRWLEASRWR